MIASIFSEVPANRRRATAILIVFGIFSAAVVVRPGMFHMRNTALESQLGYLLVGAFGSYIGAHLKLHRSKKWLALVSALITLYIFAYCYTFSFPAIARVSLYLCMIDANAFANLLNAKSG